MKFRNIVCTLPVLFVLSANADTRTDDNDAGPTSDPAVIEARALLQAGRKQIISEEILFSRTETQPFWAAYDAYREDVMKVRDRQAELIGEYLKTYRAGSVTESQAVSFVDDLLDIKSDLLKVQKKHLKHFRRVLPSRKVARFYQLEAKLDAELDAQLAIFVPLIDPV